MDFHEILSNDRIWHKGQSGTFGGIVINPLDQG